MLEQKKDLVRMVDPGYQRLISGIKAIDLYAKSIGVHLGLTRHFAVALEPIKEGKL